MSSIEGRLKSYSYSDVSSAGVYERVVSARELVASALQVGDSDCFSVGDRYAVPGDYFVIHADGILGIYSECEFLAKFTLVEPEFSADTESLVSVKEWHNTVCLDFDGVISEFGNEREGQLVEGAIEGMLALIDAGWFIEIFSGRCGTVDGRLDMSRRLEGFFVGTRLYDMFVHFDDRIVVAKVKPVAKVYVDDRGLRFTGWKDITPELLSSFRAWWQHPDCTE